jgi:hypothetical protein
MTSNRFSRRRTTGQVAQTRSADHLVGGGQVLYGLSGVGERPRDIGVGEFSVGC